MRGIDPPYHGESTVAKDRKKNRQGKP